MTRLSKTLLVCGILSSLLYVATDILGGMRYEGYSFTSRAVSELMAIGAPSEALVDPLFITYGVLALAFGVGVLLEGVGRSRALRIAAVLLIAYAAIGFTGPTLFEMRQRGAGSLASDAPHLVLTGVLVLLLLLAIGFGAFALGKRFRVYSFATLVILIVFGALGGAYGARLAAGQPTPGFGIIERINIYASLAWVAVLGIALRRRRGTAAGGSPRSVITLQSSLELSRLSFVLLLRGFFLILFAALAVRWPEPALLFAVVVAGGVAGSFGIFELAAAAVSRALPSTRYFLLGHGLVWVGFGVLTAFMPVAEVRAAATLTVFWLLLHATFVLLLAARLWYLRREREALLAWSVINVACAFYVASTPPATVLALLSDAALYVFLLGVVQLAAARQISRGRPAQLRPMGGVTAVHG